MKKSNVIILSLIMVLISGLTVMILDAAEYNAAVEQAQQKLTKLGYDPGPVDGLWGKKTEKALKIFQEDHGLSVTGKLDEETKVKLGLQMSQESPTKPSVPKRTIPAGGIKLRSTPIALSSVDIVAMIEQNGFNHPADYTNIGLSGSMAGDFPHQYESKTLEGNNVVLDHATGLMWQQAATDFVPGAEVQNHVSRVNLDRYAGFSDWRLPTIEELASLLDGPEKEVDFIDPIFEAPLWFCLSADKVKGEPSKVWVVFFEDGYVMDYEATDDFYVLLVRSLR